MVWHIPLEKYRLQLLCQNTPSRLMGSVLAISPRLNFGPTGVRGVQQTQNCSKSTASPREQALQSQISFEAGRGQYPQERQFVIALSNVQQQPGVSPLPWWVWGSLGASSVSTVLVGVGCGGSLANSAVLPPSAVRQVINALGEAISRTPGCVLLDVDAGASTNRTVYTFVGSPEAIVEGALSAARVAGQLIDMSRHTGELGGSTGADPVRSIPQLRCVVGSRCTSHGWS